MKNVKNFLNSK